VLMMIPEMQWPAELLGELGQVATGGGADDLGGAANRSWVSPSVPSVPAQTPLLWA
jgi:hypothetical protein